MYCTVDEIKNIIPESELINLTVDEPDENSVIDEQRFNDVSAWADDFINGYIRAKYRLPLVFVPTLVTKLSSDIVAYRLYMRRPQDMPEHIKNNYKFALDTLSQIQKGIIILDLPSEHPDEEIQKPQPSYLSNKNNRSIYFDDRAFSAFRGFYR